jgi:hypothetical protein
MMILGAETFLGRCPSCNKDLFASDSIEFIPVNYNRASVIDRSVKLMIMDWKKGV